MARSPSHIPWFEASSVDRVAASRESSSLSLPHAPLGFVWIEVVGEWKVEGVGEWKCEESVEKVEGVWIGIC